MNLDERIQKMFDNETGHGREMAYKLIREVLEYVKPDRKAFQMAVKANSAMWGAQIDAHNDTIDEMEARIKELGL